MGTHELRETINCRRQALSRSSWHRHASLVPSLIESQVVTDEVVDQRRHRALSLSCGATAANWSGGIRTPFNCFAGSRLAIRLQRPSVSQPGIEPGLRASRARVRIRHTPRTCVCEGGVANRIHPASCGPSGSSTMRGQKSTPPRNRTSSDRFEVCHAIHHTRRASSAARPGFEPGTSR